MHSVLGLAIVAAAVWAIIRRVDVRLALFLAALALGTVARRPDQILQKFFTTLTDDRFVVPICTAMGFAHVLRQTGCDRHLVEFLVRPVQRVRGLLVPATVLIGFLVNIPVVSQTSTAVVIGAVVLPLLAAARISSQTAGAALLLGCSVGGELLNPGAPEFRTVADATGAEAVACVRRVFPLLLPYVALATTVFWATSALAEAREAKRRQAPEPTAEPALFRVNPVKALVPLIPVTLLFLTGKPFGRCEVPAAWLVDPQNPADLTHYDSRLIGAAMLVGVCVAALTVGSGALGSARAFFEGAGYAFANIISVIVTAACFGKGVELIGLAGDLGALLQRWPQLFMPAACGLPLGFAWVSGSGMASTQSLYQFFVAPARALGADPLHVGAVVSIASAAGRTMSPVAAVTLMCATLTRTSPFELIRRVALPLTLAIGLVVLLALALL